MWYKSHQSIVFLTPMFLFFCTFTRSHKYYLKLFSCMIPQIHLYTRLMTSSSVCEPLNIKADWYLTKIYGLCQSVRTPSHVIEVFGFSALKYQRVHPKLVVIYRLTDGPIDIPADVQPNLKNSNSTDHPLSCTIPFCRQDACRYPFFLSSIRYWNQLPTKLITVVAWAFPGRTCRGTVIAPKHKHIWNMIFRNEFR